MAAVLAGLSGIFNTLYSWLGVVVVLLGGQMIRLDNSMEIIRPTYNLVRKNLRFSSCVFSARDPARYPCGFCVSVIDGALVVGLIDLSNSKGLYFDEPHVNATLIVFSKRPTVLGVRQSTLRITYLTDNYGCSSLLSHRVIVPRTWQQKIIDKVVMRMEAQRKETGAANCATLLCGTPGVGKTTLGFCLAQQLKYECEVYGTRAMADGQLFRVVSRSNTVAVVNEIDWYFTHVMRDEDIASTLHTSDKQTRVVTSKGAWNDLFDALKFTSNLVVVMTTNLSRERCQRMLCNDQVDNTAMLASHRLLTLDVTELTTQDD